TLPAIEAEAIAVCLLFSFRHPEHEQAVAEELRRRYPEAHVVASHEVAPEFREYERASTTAVDAYLGPVCARYFRSLERSCRQAGLPTPLVMRSSGGVVTVEEAAAHAALVLVSGPAGGAVGAAMVARQAGIDNAISFDMGGTSTDVCLIAGGKVERTAERSVGGLPVRLPMVDIHTVGAGGGSIVWRDAGGAIRVGPESAGANPGPACYGRGGTRPTVTDANVIVGHLPPQLLGGEMQLDVEAAKAAVKKIGDALGLDVYQAAEGILGGLRAAPALRPALALLLHVRRRGRGGGRPAGIPHPAARPLAGRRRPLPLRREPRPLHAAATARAQAALDGGGVPLRLLRSGTRAGRDHLGSSSLRIAAARTGEPYAVCRRRGSPRKKNRLLTTSLKLLKFS
ncbi:MAG: hypothetical protein C4299_00360, partial [Thermoleophilia bacterium]